jgi:ribosomal-protein-alanine N-acetyltransferase
MLSLPSHPPAPPYLIEPMKPADLEAVMEIERLSFRTPWSREVFQEELGRGWAYVDVLRRSPGGKALAFCNYWLVADEVHLLNVATHPAARRNGCAARLLEHVLDFAQRRHCRIVMLEVRRSNEIAQRLYRRFSFKAVGVRPSYYADNQEDAVVMSLDLTG